MGKNRNLEAAQNAFANLSNVDAYDMKLHIANMNLKLEQARKNGQPDLPLKALDKNGLLSDEEVNATIEKAKKGAAYNIGIKHIRYIVTNLQEHSKTAPDYMIKQIKDEFGEIGIKSDIFTKDQPPSLADIDSLLKEHEAIIKVNSAGAKKTGVAR